MLGRLARLRRLRIVGGLLWAMVAAYALAVVAYTDLTRSDPAPARCIDAAAGSASSLHEWRWWPVGWECAGDAPGTGAHDPGWALTAALTVVPAGALAVVGSGALARRAAT